MPAKSGRDACENSSARMMNEAACWRFTRASGEKVSADVPETSPAA